MADDPRSWLPDAEPGQKCGVCGGAATTDDLCLSHLDERGLAVALDRLQTGDLTLDLRGVQIDGERWEQIANVRTPDGIRGPDLSTARLTQAVFGDQVNMRGARFGDRADLRGARFGDRADLRGAAFGDRADLRGAAFGDEANLPLTVFGDWVDMRGARFGDRADLRAATFGEGASLRGAAFGDGASLRGAAFGDGADLTMATFGDEANLDEATFGERVGLRGVRFGERADLAAATFGDGADLFDITFGDEANLIMVTFGDEANLGEATFGERAALTIAMFGHSADLRGATFGDEAALTEARFGQGANLLGAVFGNRVDLFRTTFGSHSNFRGATFGDEADLTEATFGEATNLTMATFGHATNLTMATFGEGVSLVDAWFTGEVTLAGAVFAGPQRTLGPLYAADTVDLYDAQFRGETRLEIDAAGVVLSRVVFAGPVEIRVGRGRIEASETTFTGPATIAALDQARRPDPKRREAHRFRESGPLQQAQVARASMRSLRRTDVSRLTIAGIDVAATRFAGAQGLERLRLTDTRFDTHRNRQRVAEERLLDEPDDELTRDEQRMGHPRCTAGQVAEIYRPLRKSREDNADAPGGNDLYIGEQHMRRRDLREHAPQTAATRARRALLALYASIGGYGVQPVRPAVALFGLLAAAWAVADEVGLRKGATSDALIFVLRSALLLPNTSNITTTTTGDALQVALRVLGPLLITLIAFGLRAQVKR